jgi:hypothetical protein
MTEDSWLEVTNSTGERQAVAIGGRLQRLYTIRHHAHHSANVIRAHLPQPTPLMRRPARVLAVLSLVVSLPTIAAAQGQPAQPQLRIAASSFASVEVHLNARKIGSRWYEEDAGLTGPSRIAIAYGQPHARGRRIEGGLIPLDTVWRFGANTVTTLHSDVDFTLDTLRIPRGDYGLYVLSTARGWQLIVNRRTGSWGTEYDPSLDLGRVTLTARKRAEPEEALTIYLVPDSPQPTTGYAELRGRLRIVWGATELATSWRVTP